MAVFVDLDDDGDRPPDNASGWHAEPVKESARAAVLPIRPKTAADNTERANPNRNSMTEALGSYPIILEIASSIDLNTLDNLSQTCRQIRVGLLQYKSILITSTLHCSNENVGVDPEDVLRYRARAGNWFYMEDISRTSYSGKAGNCARDMVSECRRCGLVVCRNCALKPPAPKVFRERYRRLCMSCMRAPLGELVKPPLPEYTPLDAEVMQRAICRCELDGVWLCQPCGRTIRSDDHEYRTIWKWRNQYGEVLGGVGTGIGEGDRGAICGRNDECCAAKEHQQETDCDAEDAREASELDLPSLSRTSSGTSTLPSNLQGWTGAGAAFSSTPPARTPDSLFAPQGATRTPSPALLGPGYARHEIEGIGGQLKKKRVKMVRVGACVPEWMDEKASGEVLGREVRGQLRSWCGWCRRVIPGKKDHERQAIDADEARKRDSAYASSSDEATHSRSG